MILSASSRVMPSLTGPGGLVDDGLRLLEAEAGDRADDLDHLDLLLARGVEDDVELRLLLGSRRLATAAAGRRSGRRDRSGCSGHAELLLERLHELGEVEDGHALDLVDPLVLGECHWYSFLECRTRRPRRRPTPSAVGSGRARPRGSAAAARARSTRPEIGALRPPTSCDEELLARRQRGEASRIARVDRPALEHAAAQLEQPARSREVGEHLGHRCRVGRAERDAGRPLQQVDQRVGARLACRDASERVLGDAERRALRPQRRGAGRASGRRRARADRRRAVPSPRGSPSVSSATI